MRFMILNREMLALTLLLGAVLTAGAADKFYNSGAYVEPGQTGTLVFSLDNDKKYYGFQAEIELPENYEFVTVNGKADAQLTNRASGSYSLVSNMLSTRKVKIGAFSTNHEAISGSTGALLNLRVRASDGFAGGTLTISNALLIDATDNDVKLQQSMTKYAAPNDANIRIEDFDIDLGATGKVNVTYSGSAINGYETTIYLPAQLSLVEGSVTPVSTVVEKQSDGGWLFKSGTGTTGGSLFDFSVTSTGTTTENCEIVLKNQAVTLADGTIMFTPESRTIANVKVVEASSIELNHTAVELHVGNSVSLTATVLPENATDKTVVWTSSDESVVSVDANGKVTAIALGEAEITAKCGDVTASCLITVVPTTAESITLSQTAAELKVGESVTLTATVLPENATDKTVVWTSSDKSVVSVDADGMVTAVGLGETVVTAKCGDVSASCVVTVVPTPAESITLSQTTSELKVGESVTLTATVLPENATDKTVIWTSSNESVASVDADGMVTAVGLGVAQITAKCGDVIATCAVTVISTPAESITLSQTTSELKVGESVTLTATVLPENATDKTVIWTSSNESVATVDDNGKVTAVKLGETQITAKCGDATAICVVTVVPTPAECVTLSQTAAELKVGESLVLTATILPETTTDKTVVWTSSDESVVTVDADGQVTAVKVGDAVITAKCGDVSANCVITVVPILTERITLDMSEISLVVGETWTLTATVYPENATDKTVFWTSSDESVASVDADGKVTAVGLGEAEITAKCGEVSATCLVRVFPLYAQSITLDRTMTVLKATETMQLTATVLPENATFKGVTWKSSNESVATVDQSGNVTAIAVGEADIMATPEWSEATATCKVTVVPTPAQSIILSQTMVELKVGESVVLSATVLPETTTDKTVVWASTNESVVTVDADGKVTAVGVGEAEMITATCGDVTEICLVTVVPATAESIILSQTTAQLKVGEYVVLSATVLPETTTDKTVVWTSSNASVASVDANGQVIAVGLGETVITAKCGEVSAACSVAVVTTPVESVHISQTTASLKAGETIMLSATVFPEDATDKSVVWTSSDDSIATVDGDGNVTAVSVGEAVITASCGNVYASCLVTVVPTPAESIILNKKYVDLKVGESLVLIATVLPETTTDKTVVWISSNESVVTVDADGKVTAVGVGSAEMITAKCGDATAICYITVFPTPAESVTLSQTTAQLKVGESVVLSATVLPETTTDKTVVWASSNESVASVDANGKVTAVGLGETVITANCGDASATCSVAVVPTPAESIKLSQSTANLKVGESVTLTATVLPEDATDKSVIWTSSDESVATVNAEGNVTAVSVGKADIRATAASGVSAVCEVIVVQTPVEGITLSQTTAELKVGEIVTLTANILPETATDKTVVWTSSDESVASVDANGKVTAVAVGEAVVTASCGNVTASCSVTVVPTPVDGITLSQSTAELKVGESVTLTATIMPETATDKTVVWASSDESVATVDADGKVTAVAPGEAKITASCGSVSATCEVTVLPILVESITLTPDVWSGMEGDFIQLVAVVLPENATDKSLTWTSSDEAVATVDNTGLVCIQAEGSCVITVTAADGSGIEAQCVITGLSGIEAVFAADDARVDVYSLGGQLLKKGCGKSQLQQLAPGMYILRSGPKALKAIVK